MKGLSVDKKGSAFAMDIHEVGVKIDAYPVF